MSNALFASCWSAVALLATSCAVAAPAAPAALARLDAAGVAIRDTVPRDAVIAHRGLPHWAPEETAASYRLALGFDVDYVEADVQRTQDGVLICLHDDNLGRTTDVADVFPDRRGAPASAFTFDELRQLDAGSWFNAEHPDRADPAFVGARILALEELIDLVEASPKPWPGICLETKEATRFEGIEADLHELLARRGWAGGDPERRLFLQTFERSSLPLLTRYFPGVPRLLLLWQGPGYIERADAATIVEWLNFAVANGAQFVGPSLGEGSGYHDLMADWMVAQMRDAGLGICPYTLNDGFERYVGRTEGVFTDRCDSLTQYHRVRELRGQLRARPDEPDTDG